MIKIKAKSGAHVGEDKTPAENPRRVRKKRGLNPLLVIVPAVILLAVSYYLFRLTRATTDFRIPCAAEQVYAGQSYKVAKGSVISVDREGNVSLIRSDFTSVLTSLPIYYEGQNKIITAFRYSYVNPRTYTEKAVARLTEIETTDIGAVNLTHNNQETLVQDGFLYDGANFYIFLEPMTVTFNGYTFRLGRMSYVEADYRNNIMIYNRETGETYMEPATTAVTAVTESGDYSVSLLGASYQDAAGARHLLINDPSLLEDLD